MLFPVGSKVKCLEDCGKGFRKGAIYEVANPARYEHGIPKPDEYVYVLTETGQVAGMSPYRFQLVEAPASRAKDPS